MGSFSKIDIDPEGDLTLIIKSQLVKERLSKQVALLPTPAKSLNSLPGNSPSLGSLDWSHLHICVSSKHLSLASRVFKAMLSKFKEGEQLHTIGAAEVELHDDNPVALYLLLRILHCQSKYLPLIVNFEMLVSISVLIDKYELLEAVVTFTDMWYGAERKNMDAYFKNCPEDRFLGWICITWVLKKAVDLPVITKATILGSQKERLTAEELPIPAKVLGKSCGIQQGTRSELIKRQMISIRPDSPSSWD